MKQLTTLLCTILAFGTIVVQAQVKLAEPIIPVYPQLENKGSFSMIMVPDPQSYTKFAANQPLFDLQTAWIVQNIDRLNIKAALFTGDMVEQNGKQISAALPNPYNGDQTGRQQWEAVSRALSRLDNRLPYVVAQGNHDIGHITATSRHSLAPEFIRPERNILFEKCLVETCENFEGVHTMENSAYEFKDENWGNILVITTEFAPRDEVIAWAKGLVDSDKYKNHKVILLVHSWLNTAGERITKEGYTLRPCNWSEDVWQKLVYPSKNICLVLCGHTGDAPKIEDGKAINYQPTSSYRVDKAADGRNIPQMMFNSQQGDGEWNGNGGDCWLRILEFKPDGKTISVRTFSPLFAISKRTKDMAWRTDKYDEFDIVVE